MDEIKEDDLMHDTVTVGIFWITDAGVDADIIFDSQTKEKLGKYSTDYDGSHFEMWDTLAAKQFGGKYKRHDCYYYPRGRVLYNIYIQKTTVYADQKILDRLDIFEPILCDMFSLEDYVFAFDEHYQSVAKWEGK